MPQITIDDKSVEVQSGVNLIEAAKTAGVQIPHYCYHPRLSVVGSCRMCLVEIDGVPVLQPACNTQVKEGMVVKTQSPRVKDLRKSVMEFLLINHPLDCPICDQAGECKLQEYYMEHDRVESRFGEEKRELCKRVDLGPSVVLDEERCILCTRCTRFLEEIPKTSELFVSERGDRSVIQLVPGKELDNPYATNVVDICPVGALTDKNFRFQCRVWFLKETPSVCTGCSRGCNIKIHHYKGKVYRLKPRTNETVNQDWICDFGRESYHGVGAINRLKAPMLKKDGTWIEITSQEALRILKTQVAAVDPQMILGIGSAQYTNEDNFGLQRAVGVWGGTMSSYHFYDPKEAYTDDFLIQADKNPNRAGVEALGLTPLQSERRYRLFFILGDLREVALKPSCFEDGRFVIKFDTHWNPAIEFADLVLPVATFAEMEGTFVNCQNRLQKIQQAFPPPGLARPVWQWVSDFSNIAPLFLAMAEKAKGFRGLSWDHVGPLGVSL